MPAVLSIAEPRPLTSREISKVLCAMLNGVAVAHPPDIESFPTALDFVIATNELMQRGKMDLHTRELAERVKEFTLVAPGVATWFTALVATVGGFYAWCHAVDVDTAVLWVAENLSRMFPGKADPRPN